MSDETPANELLASLNPVDFALLRPHLTRIRLEQHQVLQGADAPIDYVYFPLQGMVSVVASFPTGEEIEIAAVGRDGAIGTKVGLLPQLAFARASSSRAPHCGCLSRIFSMPPPATWRSRTSPRVQTM